jgi:hypothetical protein
MVHITHNIFKVTSWDNEEASTYLLQCNQIMLKGKTPNCVQQALSLAADISSAQQKYPVLSAKCSYIIHSKKSYGRNPLKFMPLPCCHYNHTHILVLFLLYITIQFCDTYNYGYSLLTLPGTCPYFPRQTTRHLFIKEATFFLLAHNVPVQCLLLDFKNGANTGELQEFSNQKVWPQLRKYSTNLTNYRVCNLCISFLALCKLENITHRPCCAHKIQMTVYQNWQHSVVCTAWTCQLLHSGLEGTHFGIYSSDSELMDTCNIWQGLKMHCFTFIWANRPWVVSMSIAMQKFRTFGEGNTLHSLPYMAISLVIGLLLWRSGRRGSRRRFPPA